MTVRRGKSVSRMRLDRARRAAQRRMAAVVGDDLAPVTTLAEMTPSKRAEMERLYGAGPTKPRGFRGECTCPHAVGAHLVGCPATDRGDW